ncbi:MAG: hypothetical protein QGH51_07560 [Planctomycetota bacterium]|jgi:tetratricopeptide (TPR) repeat protein|nr:hypothetical protein [Planctomycetota bacterium]MDP6941863.1 hypothetical protein [Planctomycetota bacterium]
MAFRTIWLPLALLVVPACGFLTREPNLPNFEAIQEARADSAEEWLALEKAAALWSIQGNGALPQLRDWAQQPHSPLRLRAYVLDLEYRNCATRAEQLSFLNELKNQWLSSGDPEDAYLAARFSSREDALSLVHLALELEPDLVSAKVLLLGLQAHAGDPQPLHKLIFLLEENPGSAEAWRLLGRLAPFYNRADYALAAAEQEPWIQTAWNPSAYQAALALNASQPKSALSYLENAEDGMRTQLLRAQAFVDCGDTHEAGRLLDELVRQNPQSLIAHFNYGVLANGPLKQPELARREFEIVLRLAEEGHSFPLQRRLQVEIWLERLTPKVSDS